MLSRKQPLMAVFTNTTMLNDVTQGHDGASARRDYDLLDADGEQASSDLTVSTPWCASALARQNGAFITFLFECKRCLSQTGLV